MSHDPLAGLLRSFCLTTMASIYADTLQQAEQHHWGYRKFLQHLCESEAEDRRQRRIARLLKQSGLPDGKSLGNLEETLLPEKIRRQLPTLLEGGFVERGENVLAFGLPGRGKSHFVAALSRELILRHGHTVLFIPTFKLVQKLLLAKKALKLEALLKKLDRYAVVCPRRHRLRPAGPGGDGSVVHVPGRTLRAAQRDDHQQSGVLQMGSNLQRSDDDHGRD